MPIKKIKSNYGIPLSMASHYKGLNDIAPAQHIFLAQMNSLRASHTFALHYIIICK